MAYNSYITYDEYVELGGNLSEDDFPLFERKAQRYLDHITFDRIKSLTIIPDEVKEVLVEFIDHYSSFNAQNMDGQVISKYSNDVETITYRRETENEVNRVLYKLARTWLPEYLLNRSVNFDVEKYLQSTSNNP